MNIKATEQTQLALRRFTASVGDFIRYWGFRRIHGQIWAAVYISENGLSGTELAQLLGVSKALVSPALGELEEYGLIAQSGGDRKTKLYVANEDVFSVIKEILEKREKVLIITAKKRLESLQVACKADASAEVCSKKLADVAAMIQMAQTTLDLIIDESLGA
jgi:DNA-binding transcriptional regulator GbsR (MarR family)